ncbi:hypothetical protein [Streptomyces sp. CBMA156]|uniref:hypothetical protein n=1 Tax=Streptomyces sp. CBMA156 TaxID=1930280 RepID=UPI001662164A|nr:hypothetical protein [Streptomyces sp. CBMA156]MBD0675670.1 hypothetical protein [Streptomyces sp. CBMA156]
MPDTMRLDDEDFVKLYRERVQQEESVRNSWRRRSILTAIAGGQEQPAVPAEDAGRSSRWVPI